jgi:hypothetical protein
MPLLALEKAFVFTSKIGFRLFFQVFFSASPLFLAWGEISGVILTMKTKARANWVFSKIGQIFLL